MRGKNIWNIVRNHYLGGRELSLKFDGIQGYGKMVIMSGCRAVEEITEYDGSFGIDNCGADEDACHIPTEYEIERDAIRAKIFKSTGGSSKSDTKWC